MWLFFFTICWQFFGPLWEIKPYIIVQKWILVQMNSNLHQEIVRYRGVWPVVKFKNYVVNLLVSSSPAVSLHFWIFKSYFISWSAFCTALFMYYMFLSVVCLYISFRLMCPQMPISMFLTWKTKAIKFYLLPMI